MILRSFYMTHYQTRIALRALRVEKTLLKLNIPTDYYNMYRQIIIDYFFVGISVCIVAMTFNEDISGYISWECVNTYFSFGITFIFISYSRCPLLNIATALDQIKAVIFIMKDSNFGKRRKDHFLLQRSSNVSQLDVFFTISEAHTMIFESIEHITRIVSKFSMLFFCFNAFEIMVIAMTYHKEDIKTQFIAATCFYFSMLFYAIHHSAKIKKKVSY